MAVYIVKKVWYTKFIKDTVCDIASSFINGVRMTTSKDKLRELRQCAGMTQEDVAEQLDISSQTVSKWERELSYPDIFLLADISDILSISIDEMMGKE